MNIKEYIDSGILESYVLGSASEEEALELLRLKKQYPEIQRALNELEIDMQRIAEHMAVAPPPGMWNRIENSINELITTPEIETLQLNGRRYERQAQQGSGQQYIDIEAESTHIRVHKNWRWIFAAVFILGKIFLACAIYFYLENRQAQQQILELKTELKQPVQP
ncbi:hypothetical protein BEL04_12605 [Mucilaginibacter sp. PPCGB 2223]|uniref:hypothetical protein n=1 Tax=Mucilaginibacter sp. PPCGB 2223 TaxID=1886027 RepID=UPI00082710AD|nr:hypothetical protein [Mucilaginibacter sp. PPCGB 2223]OCX52310.1 hypothetical protein BEL04_12605 [Mucilaginibacter sp. PPCGB 2223]